MRGSGVGVGAAGAGRRRVEPGEHGVELVEFRGVHAQQAHHPLGDVPGLLAHLAAGGSEGHHEPALVLPACAFHRLDPALAAATAWVVPHLGRFVPDLARAAAGAEWLVRILLSYALSPSPDLVLTDPASVRRFVRTYAIPVLTPQGATA